MYLVTCQISIYNGGKITENKESYTYKTLCCSQFILLPKLGYFIQEKNLIVSKI